MDVRTIEKAKDKFCAEIEPIVAKGSISSGDFDTLYKAVCGYEKALKIEELEDDGHSQRRNSNGMWDARGSYDSYNDGNSYGRSYTRNRNSMDDGREYLMSQMRDMMNDRTLSSSTRNSLRNAMETLERDR